MPYYSDLTSPSSSYSSLYGFGPYSKHSSIQASNYSPTYKSVIPRNFRGYKPLLATISESQNAALRRINSPKLIIHSPKVPKPIKINTADIDVSSNKYRKYNKTSPRIQKQEVIVEKSTPKKEPSPVRTPSPKSSPRASVEEKEAKPNANIRRDRATVRLQTIHKDKLRNEINAIKSWRDNFDPNELNTKEKVQKKSPGEILVEKFLIRSRSKENMLKSPKTTRKASVKKPAIPKVSSFKDICTAISSDSVNEELNPGQPVAVQRRQSRQFSSDNILKELRRNSSDLTNEEVSIIDELLDQNDDAKEEVKKEKPKKKADKFETRGSVRKKKITKKKSNELITDTDSGSDKPKSPIQRRPTQKKIRRSSTDESLPSSEIIDGNLEKAYQEAIRDISQVEIESIKSQPKKIITGTVDVEEKPVLIPIIDNVEVEESPKQKKGKMFRFNVIVEEIEEKAKPRSRSATPVEENIPITRKLSKKQVNHVTVQLPQSKEAVISNIMKKRPSVRIGHILNDVKELPEKPKQEEIKEKPLPTLEIEADKTSIPKGVRKLSLSKSDADIPVDKKLPEKTNVLSKSSADVNKIKDTPLRSILKKRSTESLQTTKLEENATTEELKRRDTPSAKEENKTEANKPKKIVKKPKLTDIKDENHNDVIEEKKAGQSEETNESDNKETEPESPIDAKITSKRSLIQKANKEDPDLHVFVVPEEHVQPVKQPEPEKEKEESSEGFVPLQSNRLSAWMHPWKKPEQYDECPLELYATPKAIKGRHYPRPRHPQPVQSSEDDESSEEESEDEETSSEEETSSDECNDGADYNKIGASTSSNDSGFDSEVKGGRNKDCDVNCHKKCERLTANLCGVNQKLVAEAIESVKKGSTSESRDSPTTQHASNPAFALDSGDVPVEYTQSSTFQGFQKSGRITPPATTIPRFRKYSVEDFNFLKVLGKGAFGKVLLAELKNTEYYYAIKCLKKDVVLEDDDVECTLIERKVLALGTKHPYLCHLLCTFQTESHLFFVMEYLNGGDLMWHIQASGRFEEERARFYGAEIVSGLKFLHNKGIVYRDLKLDNILLDYDGHVRIADFGMCKLQIFLDRMADTFCGTPDYMAPEIIKGQHYNQCVDWWSFGVLLYEMLIGQSPFSGCDEDELFWSICNEKPVLPRFLSKEATEVLLKFLEKDWNKRLGNRFSSHGDIQDQPFFRPIDWHALESRQLEPPFKPSLLHPLDTQYFDKTFTVERAKITPIEQTILQSMDQTQFQGFSYTNPNATDK